MSDEIVVPPIPEQASPAPESVPDVQPDEVKQAADTAEQGEGETTETEKKPEKTEAERERDRLKRGYDRRNRQLADARAKADLLQRQLDEALTKLPKDANNTGDDGEPVTLTKAQQKELIEQRARELAPTIAKQEAEVERRRKAALSVQESLGDEAFAELTSELAELFEPARQLALLETDKPAEVVRFLTDPENDEEVKRLAALSDFQFGREITKLEGKLTAKPKAELKPSKIPDPIEEVQGRTPRSAPDPMDTKAWIAYENKREREARRH